MDINDFTNNLNMAYNLAPTPVQFGSMLGRSGQYFSNGSDKILPKDVKSLDKNKYAKILRKTNLVKKFLNNFDNYYDNSENEGVLIENLCSNFGISRYINPVNDNSTNYSKILPNTKKFAEGASDDSYSVDENADDDSYSVDEGDNEDVEEPTEMKTFLKQFRINLDKTPTSSTPSSKPESNQVNAKEMTDLLKSLSINV